MKKHFTVDDLAKMVAKGFEQMATKADLVELESRVALKTDLLSLENRANERMNEIASTLTYRIEKLSSRIIFSQTDLKRKGVETLADEFTDIKRRLHRLEKSRH